MSSFAGNLGPAVLGSGCVVRWWVCWGGLGWNLLGAIVGEVVLGRFLVKIFLGGTKADYCQLWFCRVRPWIFCVCMEVGNLLNCDTAFAVNSILERFPSNLCKFTRRDLLSTFLSVLFRCVFVLFRVFRIGGVDSRESRL